MICIGIRVLLVYPRMTYNEVTSSTPEAQSGHCRSHSELTGYFHGTSPFSRSIVSSLARDDVTTIMTYDTFASAGMEFGHVSIRTMNIDSLHNRWFPFPTRRSQIPFSSFHCLCKGGLNFASFTQTLCLFLCLFFHLSP